MKHELSYWEDLAERYFQAETSEAEEAQLRKFLCSDAANAPRFDEIRATMSYLYVASAPTAPSPLPLWGSALKRRASGIVALPQRGSGEGAGLRSLFAAIAACLCVAFFLGWYKYQQHNISSVRVAGEDIEADASLLMQQQMAEVLNPINMDDR